MIAPFGSSLVFGGASTPDLFFHGEALTEQIERRAHGSTPP
jgi:hypothetical protein